LTSSTGTSTKTPSLLLTVGMHTINWTQTASNISLSTINTTSLVKTI